MRAPVSVLIAMSLGVFAAAQTPAIAAVPAAAAQPTVMQHSTGSPATRAEASLLAATSPAPAPQASHASTAAAGGVTSMCATPTSKFVARCFAMRVNAVNGGKGLRAAATPPSGLGPSDLVSAYNLPKDGGAGATIAIVDAFDDPNAASDLAVYRQQYGLPTLNPGQFIKVNQEGLQSNYPRADSGWAGEISLDLDMVSAVAPKANIILVEANNAITPDLGASVNEAVALGAGYVSNSYGSGYSSTPGSGESAADLQASKEYYDHPGVAVVASSGDEEYGVSFPASSPYVTSVGGTSLVKDPSTARGWSETAWNSRGSDGRNYGPGSGCSTIEPKPAFQKDTGCTNRTVADVSAVADPATGVAMYDTYGETGWLQAGGTSASSPIIASTYADAGPVAKSTYPNSYPYAHTDTLNDVTSGSNGTCTPAYLCTAGPGYDGPTGLGTPNGTAAFSGGPVGTLSGTVTDASTGKPVSGAKVSVSGPSPETTATGADGTYQLRLAPGSYDVTVAAFDYTGKPTDTIVVTADNTSTANMTLTKVPTVTVSGTVTDASGHGWPLYAAIKIDGTPYGTLYTNPVTGTYSVQLPENGSYTLHTTSNYPGYTARDTSVTTKTTSVVHNIGLTAELLSAHGSAPGYTEHASGNTETFDGTTLPAGWSADATEGQPWQIYTNLGDNPTGGTGNLAMVLAMDQNLKPVPTDSALLTSVVTVPASETPFVSFDTVSIGGVMDLDYSADGGKTWTTERQDIADKLGLQTVELPASGKTVSARVRFRYQANTPSSPFGLGSEIDNVHLGGAWVTPQTGDLIVGNITDGMASKPLDGARVSVAGRPQQSALSAPMAGLAGRSDGFYWFFSSLTGRQTVTATAYGHDPASAKVKLDANKVTGVDLTQHAGRLVTSSSPISATVPWQGSATRDLTLTNTGDGPLTVKLDEFSGSTTPAQTQGPALERVPINRNSLKTHGLPIPTSVVNRTPARTNAKTNETSGAATTSGPDWTSIADLPSGGWAMVAGSYQGTLYAGLGAKGASWDTNQTFYAYDPAAKAWRQKASAPYAAEWGQGNFIGGKFYVTGGMDASVRFTAKTQVYDPATNSWSTAADNPSPTVDSGAAVLDGKLYVVGGITSTGTTLTTVSAVKVYDPKTDTWSTAHSYPESIEGESCGAIAGKLYCAGGDNGAGDNGITTPVTTDAYVYNPSSDTWQRVADMPLGLDTAAYSTADGRLLISGGSLGDGTRMTNAGYAYDPAMNWWTPLPNAPTASLDAVGALGFYSIGGWQSDMAAGSVLSGYDQVSPVNVPWLSESRTTLTIQPGHHATVRVQLNARDAALTRPGTETATLMMETNSQYPNATIPVSMTVQAP
ncbi:carboxypeptidase regulatory-like domain-containing protein [Streptomyces sp. NPDC047009]|uniref:carboxypeptidase regulatory-like domain-containing protein n=1 Tax=Streptomyces sp. NPDC047009 TaxID=3154496 RepID=UPI0033C65B3F